MTDSILIVGGGIAGLHAAIECANAGAQAIVVERGPVVGGILAATLTDPSGIGNRSEGVELPLLQALSANANIEIITLADVRSIEGRPGNFRVSIREQSRFVTDACTRCKKCHTVCPVVRPNEADAGLTYRKAIYTPMADALPSEWAIDIMSCLNTPPNYLPCQRCVEVCDDNAIRFDLPLETNHERQVGAVILAAGFRNEDSGRFVEIGYGEHPDVVTSAELQRLLESPGPTGGFAARPSDEAYPERVLLVLDDLSQFALYITASQVHQLLAQDIDTVAVLILGQPTNESQRSAVHVLAEEAGIQVYWGAMFKLDPNAENTLAISYEDLTVNRYVTGTYDLVVLCADVEPPEGLAGLADSVGVELTDEGYVRALNDGQVGVGTSRPGVFVAGCASGPKNIKESLADAQAAAESALSCLDPRLLRMDRRDAAGETIAQATTQLSPDAMRQQIERLLYALIDR